MEPHHAIVEIPSIGIEKDALPPIRLIDYKDFARRTSFPRYPENKDITVVLDKINKDDSFVVFISHCW